MLCVFGIITVHVRLKAGSVGRHMCAATIEQSPGDGASHSLQCILSVSDFVFVVLHL